MEKDNYKIGLKLLDKNIKKLQNIKKNIKKLNTKYKNNFLHISIASDIASLSKAKYKVFT